MPIDVPVENSSLGVLTLSTINGSAKIDRPPPFSDGDLMDSKQEAMFEQVLLEAVDQAKAFDYHPNRFVAMIRSKGPFQTVKDIVASAKPSDGFNELLMAGRMDLTCEAIIVQTEWRTFFDEDLLAIAERRLTAHGYAWTRFAG